MKSAWPPVSITQRRLDLSETIGALRDLVDESDDAIENALCRYLVVRSAGFIEATRDDVADEYSKSQASTEIWRRITSNLRKGQGAAPDQLLAFVGSFSIVWKGELKDYLDDDEGLLRSQIFALVSSRKKIAHGDGDPVTKARALVWAEAAMQISDWFIAKFDPSLKLNEP